MLKIVEEEEEADLVVGVTSNSFFCVPIYHFPWSDEGRERRLKKFDSDSSATA